MRSSALVLVLVVGAAVAASASAGRAVGFYGCRAFTAKRPAAVVKPRSIMVACGDGNFYLTGLRWSSWRAAAATGSGTAHANDCKPACYAGHFHAYAATVRLSAPKACKGARVFTRIAWSVPRLKHGGHSATTFSCS